MNRPRDRRRRDWPRGLREPRPGYYTWRHPDGRDLTIGRVPLFQAKQETIAANEYVLAQRPSLVEQLTGAWNTVGDLLDRMPKAENANTAKSQRSLDKKIRAAHGALTCQALTVKHCADLIEGEIDAGYQRTAQALRSRYVAVCAKGMTLGWMDSNAAEPTDAGSVEVQRGRLTLDTFRAIHAKAGEVKEWLPGAMILALVSGQDRSTLSGLRRSVNIGAEFLSLQRGKTGVHIEIPLALRLNVLGITLTDALKACESTVRSLKAGRDYVIHHRREFGNAPLGGKVHPDAISEAFTDARKLAGVPDAFPNGKLAPTFHELRSLAKRLYKSQGDVDSKALLGHLTEEMSDLYGNPRGAEPIRVSLTKNGTN